jgi:mono/diheme cytochrome c family protein
MMRGEQRTGWSRCALAALAVAGAIGAGVVTRAEGQPAETKHPGHEAFLQYCAACHGAEARGDGPAASALETRPPDLTRLSQAYGSPLDKHRLVVVVDGRSMPRAHGSSEMPVWGRKLLEAVPPSAGKDAFKRGTLLVILDWIETVQQR